jgi:hypothetical protein
MQNREIVAPPCKRRAALSLSPSEKSACSAKGAAFMVSLGQRPRYSCNAKTLALKAQFIRTDPDGIDRESVC